MSDVDIPWEPLNKPQPKPIYAFSRLRHLTRMAPYNLVKDEWGIEWREYSLSGFRSTTFDRRSNEELFQARHEALIGLAKTRHKLSEACDVYDNNNRRDAVKELQENVFIAEQARDVAVVALKAAIHVQTTIRGELEDLALWLEDETDDCFLKLLDRGHTNNEIIERSWKEVGSWPDNHEEADCSYADNDDLKVTTHQSRHIVCNILHKRGESCKTCIAEQAQFAHRKRQENNVHDEINIPVAAELEALKYPPTTITPTLQLVQPKRVWKDDATMAFEETNDDSATQDFADNLMDAPIEEIGIASAEAIQDTSEELVTVAEEIVSLTDDIVHHLANETGHIPTNVVEDACAEEIGNPLTKAIKEYADKGTQTLGEEEEEEDAMALKAEGSEAGSSGNSTDSTITYLCTQAAERVGAPPKVDEICPTEEKAVAQQEIDEPSTVEDGIVEAVKYLFDEVAEKVETLLEKDYISPEKEDDVEAIKRPSEEVTEQLKALFERGETGPEKEDVVEAIRCLFDEVASPETLTDAFKVAPERVEVTAVKAISHDVDASLPQDVKTPPTKENKMEVPQKLKSAPIADKGDAPLEKVNCAPRRKKETIFTRTKPTVPANCVRNYKPSSITKQYRRKPGEDVIARWFYSTRLPAKINYMRRVPTPKDDQAPLIQLAQLARLAAAALIKSQRSGRPGRAIEPPVQNGKRSDTSAPASTVSFPGVNERVRKEGGFADTQGDTTAGARNVGGIVNPGLDQKRLTATMQDETHQNGDRGAETEGSSSRKRVSSRPSAFFGVTRFEWIWKPTSITEMMEAENKQ